MASIVNFLSSIIRLSLFLENTVHAKMCKEEGAKGLQLNFKGFRERSVSCNLISYTWRRHTANVAKLANLGER